MILFGSMSKGMLHEMENNNRKRKAASKPKKLLLLTCRPRISLEAVLSTQRCIQCRVPDEIALRIWD